MSSMHVLVENVSVSFHIFHKVVPNFYFLRTQPVVSPYIAGCKHLLIKCVSGEKLLNMNFQLKWLEILCLFTDKFRAFKMDIIADFLIL